MNSQPKVLAFDPMYLERMHAFRANLGGDLGSVPILGKRRRGTCCCGRRSSLKKRNNLVSERTGSETALGDSNRGRSLTAGPSSR